MEWAAAAEFSTFGCLSLPMITFNDVKVKRGILGIFRVQMAYGL